MAEPTAHQILDTPMSAMSMNDANAETIRGYLAALLTALWQEGEDFSGKRPLGNSGWDWDLYRALAEAGHIASVIDGNGFLDDVDTDAGRDLIASAIKALGENA